MQHTERLLRLTVELYTVADRRFIAVAKRTPDRQHAVCRLLLKLKQPVHLLRKGIEYLGHSAFRGYIADRFS